MRNNDYIPVDDAAALLGVSTRVAYRTAAQVRTRKDGRRVLFHRGDIEALAATRASKAQPKPVGEPPAPQQPVGARTPTGTRATTDTIDGIDPG